MAAAGLAVALLAAACGEDGTSTAPTTAPTTTSAAEPTVTTAPAAEPGDAAADEPTVTTVSAAEPGDAAADEPTVTTTAAPGPPDGAAPSGDSPRGELRWSDVVDDLSGSAEACILESLGEEDLDAVLARPVAFYDFPTDDDASLLACLGPERALDVFLSAQVWSMQSDSGIVIGDEEKACLRESMADFDVIGVLEGLDDGSAAPALVSGFGRCLGDAFLSLMLLDSGVAFEDLGDGEKACLRESMADFDVIGALEGRDDGSTALALVSGLGRCLGDAFLSLMLLDSGVAFEDLGDGEKACLRERQAGVDWDGFGDDPEAGLSALLNWSLGLVECLPEEELGFDGASPIEAPAGLDDDHADTLAGATATVVGEPARGSLEYGGDVDFFVFDAVEGERYELGVEPGTLEDPTVALYDAEGRQLGFDDDSGDSLAPLLFWSADGSGPRYVEVRGAGFVAGSYTLTVARG